MDQNNYCQIIVGPPGAGKTTYTKNIARCLLSLDKIPIVINLDPGNESNQFSELNLSEIIKTREISSELHIGPNGAIVFAMEFLEKNMDWLEKKFIKFEKKYPKFYLLVDLPGQIEIFTHHSFIRNFIKRLKMKNLKNFTIIITDSFFWKDNSVIYSILLVCLNISLNLGLPNLVLMSKADLFFRDYSRKKYFQNPKRINFRPIFHFFSIFSWANKYNNSLNESLFGFSSILSFPLDSFNQEHLKKILSQLSKKIN